MSHWIYWAFAGVGTTLIGVVGKWFVHSKSSPVQTVKNSAHSRNFQVGGDINLTFDRKDKS